VKSFLAFLDSLMVMHYGKWQRQSQVMVIGAGNEQEHGATHFSAQGLAGAQARHRASAADSGAALGGDQAGPTLGNRPVSGLGWPGWLAFLSTGDRLPHPRVAGLAPVAQRQGNDGSGGTGAGADLSIRHAWPRTGTVLAAIGQRSGVHKPDLHETGQELRLAAGVHHTAMPAAERYGGTRDPVLEGTVCASAPL